ncbi:MAG TPA: hypothetical protein VF407_15780 [Polyangiaceae bacterium]
MTRVRKHLLFSIVPALGALFVACSSSSSSGGTTTSDAGSEDASTTSDASVAVGEGGPGDECAFNRDCIAADRCECDESTGCFCEAGARGTGKNGVDSCTSGDDCSSSLCVEGPDGGSFCSDECTSAADCTGALPQCTDVSFVGKICVRNP